jgi:hypothetical protein
LAIRRRFISYGGTGAEDGGINQGDKVDDGIFF